MDRGPDLGEGVLGAHGAAPDLRVVEEEELVVRHVQPRQQRLLAVVPNPLLVCLQARNKAGMYLYLSNLVMQVIFVNFAVVSVNFAFLPMT